MNPIAQYLGYTRVKSFGMSEIMVSLGIHTGRESEYAHFVVYIFSTGRGPSLKGGKKKMLI
jgi:hypothetical protein